MSEGEGLIPKHGGYRKLKSFQLAQLVYDVTVRFCERYVDGRSRTRDQMVQAARSGVQNIAEGSRASGTSKKAEMKLTNVARASLEELRLDYEDYLRQHGLRQWVHVLQRDRRERSPDPHRRGIQPAGPPVGRPGQVLREGGRLHRETLPHTTAEERRALTKREINLRVFQGRDYPGVFWQPRVEPWYAWHKEVGTLPAQFAGMSLLEFYDDLDISMRYMQYYTGLPGPVVKRYTEPVEVHHEEDGDRAVTITRTPHGDLTERLHLTVDKTWRTVEFPVKTTQDLRALKWLFERTAYEFVAENFERGSRFVGDRGEPQFWLPKSPYQALCQQQMKLQDHLCPGRRAGAGRGGDGSHRPQLRPPV